MRTLITYLPVVACLAMMLFMCGPMLARSLRGKPDSKEAPPSDELAQLRDELADLKAKLGRTEPVDSERS